MFIIHLLALLLSIAVLVWGADKFVDNSSLLAKNLGMSELAIGLTIVALGTSAPEIFVGISSVINNSEELAMGAVVGSNISNIAIFDIFEPTTAPIASSSLLLMTDDMPTKISGAEVPSATIVKPIASSLIPRFFARSEELSTNLSAPHTNTAIDNKRANK